MEPTLKQIRKNMKRNNGLYSYLFDEKVLIELKEAIERFKERYKL